jgi:hypothetical protein
MTLSLSMKVFDLHDKQGRLHAFEVSNLRIWRRGVVKVVKTIPSATITRVPLRFLSWFREEEFCEFTIGEKRFVALEPFGDNSRYLIAARPAGWCAELQLIRDKFAAY